MIVTMTIFHLKKYACKTKIVVFAFDEKPDFDHKEKRVKEWTRKRKKEWARDRVGIEFKSQWKMTSFNYKVSKRIATFNDKVDGNQWAMNK